MMIVIISCSCTVYFCTVVIKLKLSDMVALKLPEREFKGLLNFVRERINKAWFTELIYSGQL